MIAYHPVIKVVRGVVERWCWYRPRPLDRCRGPNLQRLSLLQWPWIELKCLITNAGDWISRNNEFFERTTHVKTRVCWNIFLFRLFFKHYTPVSYVVTDLGIWLTIVRSISTDAFQYWSVFKQYYSTKSNTMCKGPIPNFGDIIFWNEYRLERSTIRSSIRSNLL